jgi:hypothetical protein
MIDGYDHRPYRRGARRLSRFGKSRCMHFPFSLVFRRVETRNGSNRLTRLTTTQVKSGYSTLRDFAYRISGGAMTGGLTVRYPGCRNTETPYLVRTIIIFRVSHFGFSGLAGTRELANRYLGYRITETPNIIRAKPFRHFPFRDFALSENKGSRS